MTGLNEHAQIPDAEIFRDFFEQISHRAAVELSLDVQTHSMPAVPGRRDSIHL